MSANNIIGHCLSQEGGAKLIYYLLSAAVQQLDRLGGDLPSVSNVHEWCYQDLMCFPEAAQRECVKCKKTGLCEIPIIGQIEIRISDD